MIHPKYKIILPIAINFPLSIQSTEDIKKNYWFYRVLEINYFVMKIRIKKHSENPTATSDRFSYCLKVSFIFASVMTTLISAYIYAGIHVFLRK